MEVERSSKDGSHRAQAYRELPDIRERRYRYEIMMSLADGANRIVNAFRYRIERLLQNL